jgi:GDP-L-fucose synthase
VNNIHLTGQHGLVGNAIKKEISVIEFNKKINNLKEYSEFLLENKIDTIIHAAGKVGGVLNNQNNKIEFYLKNSNLGNIVFEAAYLNNINKFINLSSTCVFPDKIDYPLKEEYIMLGEPHNSNNGYAYSKRMMQYLCTEAHKEGKNYLTIIPTNLFGPFDNFNIENGHFIPSVIHKCFLAKKHNTDLIIWGDGKPLREFVYVNDLSKIIKLLIDQNIDYDSIIVSNSAEYSIEEVVKMIADIFSFKGNIVFDETKPMGQMRKPTDTSRMKKLLPNFKFEDLYESLGETIEWFESNYSIARR